MSANFMRLNIPQLSQAGDLASKAPRLSEASDLAKERTLLVEIGEAPDGLPWLLRVDRRDQIEALTSSVVRAFGVDKLADLPERLRAVVESELSTGLYGIHDADLGDGRSATVYVSRVPLKHLVASTLLDRLIVLRSSWQSVPDSRTEVVANTAVVAAPLPSEPSPASRLEMVEQSVLEMQTARHLAIDTSTGAAMIAGVRPQDRALRRPSAPFRPLRLEQLAALPGTNAIFPERGRVPLDDGAALRSARIAAARTGYWPDVRYEVTKAAVVDLLAGVARAAGRLHAGGRLHGDLAPGNVLTCAGGPVLIDTASPEVGSVLGLATFEWAAPEQIIGRPADARTDVFAIGKMLNRLVGGVAFGEETTHVIPIGGQRAERVQLLRCEGVYIDVLGTTRSRAWQLAWSSLLSSAMHADPDKRPRDGNELADRIATVAAAHPLDGNLTISGSFGRVEEVEIKGGHALAHVLDDVPGS